MELINNQQNAIQVHTTTDYSLFKTLEGNRDVNHVHLARLKESMRKNHLTTIIMVNEKFEIIDGQHRFLISQELNLPINYVVSKNYGLKEVQVLNANMKTWSVDDYLTGYCDLGYEDYLTYSYFMDKYGFQNMVALALLSGQFVCGNAKASLTTRFKEGTFKVVSLEDAEAVAEKIYMIKPYYKGFLRRSFVYALVTMLKNENFDFNEFLTKLKQQPTAMKDCVTTTQYKELMEVIYNYRRREKVNLRF